MTTTTTPTLDNSAQTPPQQQAQQQAQVNPCPITVSIAPDNHPSPSTNAADDPPARAQRQRERCTLIKIFGHIPDVPVLCTWDTQIACSVAAVHRPPIAGIYGNKIDGVFSIILSSRYADNEDGGDVIIYTGAGGRKKWTDGVPPKRLRVGPQTEDQTWDHPQNKALIISFLTGNPVRVVRSWKSLSQYAPTKGYRYDGLYKVAAYWTAKGRNGKQICRCRLERLPNQPPIPRRQPTISTRKPRGRQILPRRPSPSPFSSTPSHPPGENFDLSAMINTQGEHEPSTLPTILHQQVVPDSSSGNDVAMSEEDVGVKATQPLPPRQESGNTVVRYRWNRRTHELIRLAAPDSIPVDPQEEDEVDRLCEDDSTLVSAPSEDGHFDTTATPERLGMGYFSGSDEGGGTPPLGNY